MGRDLPKDLCAYIPMDTDNSDMKAWDGGGARSRQWGQKGNLCYTFNDKDFKI